MCSESESIRKVLDLCRRERLGKCVGYHFFSRTVNKLYFPVFNNPSFKVETDVDMFGTSVVLMFYAIADWLSENRVVGGKVMSKTCEIRDLSQSASLVA